MRDTDLNHLHPTFRELLRGLQAKLAAENIPLLLFEGARTPARQAALYAQGRTTPGKIVTRAAAWESFHQYGFAADFVFWTAAGGWSWSEPKPGMWSRYAELAKTTGLRQLSFEQPHVELPLSLADLRAGKWPDPRDTGAGWLSWLETQIEAFPDGAPPHPGVSMRPALST